MVCNIQQGKPHAPYIGSTCSLNMGNRPFCYNWKGTFWQGVFIILLFIHYIYLYYLYYSYVTAPTLHISVHVVHTLFILLIHIYSYKATANILIHTFICNLYYCKPYYFPNCILLSTHLYQY